MNQAVFQSRPSVQTAEGSHVSGFCLLTAATIMALQLFHAVSVVLLKLIWSDEGKAILGSSVFYPTVAMTVLFIVARMVPTRVVNYCAGFCKRKALSAWSRIKKAMAKQATLAAKFTAKKSQLIASAHIMLGAIELICL